MIKITEITEWEEDSLMIDGDASHEGRNHVLSLVEEEEIAKKEEGEAVGLPFISEADNVEDALQEYNDTHCEFDYFKAVECEWEEV